MMEENDSRSRRYIPTYSLPTSRSVARLASVQLTPSKDSAAKLPTVSNATRRRTTTLNEDPAHSRQRSSGTPRPPVSSMHGIRRTAGSRLPTPIKERAIVKGDKENLSNRPLRLLGPVETSVTSPAAKPCFYSPTASAPSSSRVPSLLPANQSDSCDSLEHIPTLHPRGMPRSNTYNVLSSLKSSLSKSNIVGLTTSRSSVLQSLSTGKSTALDTVQGEVTSIPPSPVQPGAVQRRHGSSGYGPPKSTFPGSHRLVDKALPTPQWIGRFTNLKDRFLNELLDEQTYHSRLPNIPSFLPLTIPEREASADLVKSTRFEPIHRPATPRSPESADSSGVYNELFLHKKIFVHLAKICITGEAQRSLRDFQQSFARREGKVELLPVGGTMTDKEGMLTRAGKFLTGSTGRERDRHGRILTEQATTTRVQYADALGEVDRRYGSQQ